MGEAAHRQFVPRLPIWAERSSDENDCPAGLQMLKYSQDARLIVPQPPRLHSSQASPRPSTIASHGSHLPSLPHLLLPCVLPRPHSLTLAPPGMEHRHLLVHDLGRPRQPQRFRQLCRLEVRRHQPSPRFLRHLSVRVSLMSFLIRSRRFQPYASLSAPPWVSPPLPSASSASCTRSPPSSPSRPENGRSARRS